MKKVLCLIDTLGHGGAERQMVGLAVLLKQRGYHTDLVTYHPHDFYAELARKQGIGTLTLRVKDSQWSKFNAVRNHIKKTGGYDVVIAYKDGPTIISCLLRMMGMRFKLIVSERNTTQVLNRHEKIKFLAYRVADYVVPNSHSQEDFIKEHFPKLRKKTLAITNFTDTDAFCSVSVANHDGLQVLTTARIACQKNVLRYLDAIALFKQSNGQINVHFDWYGEVQRGEESYGEEMKKKVSELHLEDVITFHPATTGIIEKYQQCDVFCLPSNYEGFPNVVCEAMSCGKPVLCSRVCDNPYIVKEGENALMFDNEDIQDIASKLLQICTMPKEELERWGYRSREIAVDKFSMESFVNKYINLIES